MYIHMPHAQATCALHIHMPHAQATCVLHIHMPHAQATCVLHMHYVQSTICNVQCSMCMLMCMCMCMCMCMHVWVDMCMHACMCGATLSHPPPWLFEFRPMCGVGLGLCLDGCHCRRTAAGGVRRRGRGLLCGVRRVLHVRPGRLRDRLLHAVLVLPRLGTPASSGDERRLWAALYRPREGGGCTGPREGGGAPGHSALIGSYSVLEYSAGHQAAPKSLIPTPDTDTMH